MENLIGKKFGKWLVVKVEKPLYGRSILWAKCTQCGEVKMANKHNLLSGASTKCRECYVKEHRIKDEDCSCYSWTLWERERTNKKRAWFVCGLCGELYNFSISCMLQGTVRQCYCQNPRKTKLPGYNVWSQMMRRCYNKKDSNFESYGGRGIEVVSEWHKFINFSKWYEEKIMYNFKNPDRTQIDRRDNDKGYSPGNCRAADSSMQATNRRLFKSNSSGYRNVNLRPNGLFRVRIHVKGKRIIIGEYETAKQAAKARNAYIKKRKLDIPLEIFPEK